MYCVTCRAKRGGEWGGAPGVRSYLVGDRQVTERRFQGDVLVNLRAQESPRLVAFLHGYNVRHGQAIAATERLEAALSPLVPGLVMVSFSWPSEGLLTHYLDDRGEARYAGEQLARLVLDVRRFLEREKCTAQLSLVMHSMGNYVGGRAARYAAEAMGYPATWNVFSEVALIAPDLDAEALEPGGEAHELPVFARRLTVYWSRHDRALLASSAKRAGITGARLGRHGPARRERLPSHVVDVDCSALGLDHSDYFDNPLVVRDLAAVLRGVDRETIAEREPVPGGGYRMTGLKREAAA